jgi:hypothetical protein
VSEICRSFMRYAELGEEDVRDAFTRLGFTSRVEEEIGVSASDVIDEFVIQFYKDRLSTISSPHARVELDDALKVIAKHRNSDQLMNIALGITPIVNEQEAYEELQAEPGADDDALIRRVLFLGNAEVRLTIYRQYMLRKKEEPAREQFFRQCLQVIVDASGNSRLFLRGYVDQNYPGESRLKLFECLY